MMWGYPHPDGPIGGESVSDVAGALVGTLPEKTRDVTIRPMDFTELDSLWAKSGGDCE